jgi:fatty acid desaturase
MRLIPAEELRILYAKSDRHGVVRTLAHLALLAAAAALVAYGRGRWWLPIALILDGLVIVSLFAVMHECVHGSAFRTRRLNDVVGWLAGAAILYNATYYRQFHFAHHRYAQDPTRDPELLTTPPPRSRAQYWLRASALPYWRLRIANLVDHARGRFDGLPFVPAAAHAEVVRSARLVLALLSLQILVGALNVWLDEYEVLILTHLALGTLLWAGVVGLALQLYPVGAPAPRRAARRAEAVTA